MFECFIITAVAMITFREYEVLDQPRLTTRGGNRKEFNDSGSGLSTLKEYLGEKQIHFHCQMMR